MSRFQLEVSHELKRVCQIRKHRLACGSFRKKRYWRNILPYPLPTICNHPFQIRFGRNGKHAAVATKICRSARRGRRLPLSIRALSPRPLCASLDPRPLSSVCPPIRASWRTGSTGNPGNRLGSSAYGPRAYALFRFHRYGSAICIRLTEADAPARYPSQCRYPPVPWPTDPHPTICRTGAFHQPNGFQRLQVFRHGYDGHTDVLRHRLRRGSPGSDGVKNSEVHRRLAQLLPEQHHGFLVENAADLEAKPLHVVRERRRRICAIHLEYTIYASYMSLFQMLSP